MSKEKKCPKEKQRDYPNCKFRLSADVCGLEGKCKPEETEPIA